MSLADPLVFSSPLWLPTSCTLTGGTAGSLSRVADGVYSLDSATIDEPKKLVVKNGMPESNIKPTRFAYAFHWHKNAPSGSYPVGVFPPDDYAIVEISARYIPRSFTENDLSSMVYTLTALSDPGTMKKFMQGNK